MTIFDRRESNLRAYCRVYNTVFDKAVNAKQYDEAGKEYIDFFAGAGVLNFGHNNEHMTQAVIKYIQSNGVTHSLDMSTTIKRKFMEQFESTILKPRDMPHLMQFVGPTGTNAVEAAIKLARRVTGRMNIAAFHHGFHGMTLGSLAATANSYFRNAAGVPLTHVSHSAFGCEITCPGCKLNCGEDSIATLRAQYMDTSSGVDKPAAFLVEVIQAEGGVNVADKAWLKALSELAKEIGALLILDDIQAAMGRTGSFFSFDDYDVDPDIVCLAKGLGGWGTPIAMNLVKPEHDAYWNPGEHTGTFRGQSLSFVAGIEALRYFETDELMQAVKTKSAFMFKQLEALTGVGSIQLRGKGMMIGIDIGDGEIVKRIVAKCFDEGLLVAACGTGGKVIKLIPPLTIEQDVLEKGMKLLIVNILQEVQ